MKYLQDYMEEKQTRLLKQTGSFFAFSQEQLTEQAKPKTKYVNMGGGLITEKPNVKKVINGMDKIYRTAIQEDIKENGINKIILRELINHEAFYVGDIEDTKEKLIDYPVTEEHIIKIYRANYEKHA